MFNLSLDNMGLSSIDLVLLHRPMQIKTFLGEENFKKKISNLFEIFEKKIQDGQLKYYGVSSWNSFRSTADDKHVHCNLVDFIKLAEQVGGPNHGFKFITIPVKFNYFYFNYYYY